MQTGGVQKGSGAANTVCMPPPLVACPPPMCSRWRPRCPPLFATCAGRGHTFPPSVWGVRATSPLRANGERGAARERGDVKAKMEGGTMARGRNRVGAGKEAKVCVVTDNLGGQHESRGGTSRQAKAVSRKARAGAGQGKAGMMRQDEGEHNKTGAGRQVQSKVGWAREIGRMEEENARGDKVGGDGHKASVQCNLLLQGDKQRWWVRDTTQHELGQGW
ncbi:hypothetical protein V8E53_005521 [Lactarius tabidus]